MTQNRVLIITIIVLVVLALAAVITILLNQANRNASLQTTETPSTSGTEELTAGDSDEEIQTDLNNTVVDESDQDLKQLETDINSL